MGYKSESMNSASFKSCKGIKDASGNISSDWQIIDNPSVSDFQLGDLVIINGGGNHHGEIFVTTNGSTSMSDIWYGFNFGWSEGITRSIDAGEAISSGTPVEQAVVNARSTINGHHKYDRIIRFVGNIAGSSASSSASVSSGQTAAQFFLNDLAGSRISSHITRNNGDFHGGTDFACAEGTPVHIPIGGKVIAAGTSSSMGNYVQILDNDGKYWRFMHMKNKPMVSNGDSVSPGTQIGVVGNTGQSSSAHLHVDIANSDISKAGGLKYVNRSNILDSESYTLTGRGKSSKDKLKDNEYGGGSSLSHIYQRDFENYGFNTGNDTIKQTLGDSGCGPAAAATVNNLYKKKFGKGKITDTLQTIGNTAKNVVGDIANGVKEAVNTLTGNNSNVNASSTQGNALGKTATRSDNYGNTFKVTIEQEHIDIFNQCKACGCSDAAACGVLGNIHQETGGSGAKIKKIAEGVRGKGGGIMQWTPPSKHESWAQSNGYSNPWTWEANLAHMCYELQHEGNWNKAKNANPPLSSEGYTPCSNNSEFMALTDPAAAAVNFERAFEGSGDWNGRNSEGIVYKENQLRDRLRVGPAICYYECLVGTWDGSSSVSVSNGGNSSNGSSGSYINLITDGPVNGDVLKDYLTEPSIWDENNNDNDNPSNTSSSAEPSSSNTSSSASTSTGDNASSSTKSSISTPSMSTINPSNNNNSSSTPSSNNSVVNNGGNSSITLTKSNNNMIVNSKGNNTIVICNNFNDKTKANLKDIVDNFKHLNGTQSNALKVLKAISDLIKDDNTGNTLDLMLGNDGLNLLLKGI